MITYLIIDDETAAHDIIEDYANNLPFLSLKKHCYNAFEAIEYLNNNSIDLIFLDINMPKLSGFEFLKSLPNPPKIIVTTAYKEYAIEGYELRIDDYLLKPFSLERFISAVNKIRNAIEQKNSFTTTEEPSIFLKDNKKHHQIKLKDILFLEAYGNYVKVYLHNQMIMTHQTLSSFYEILPENEYIKVHKSFIVAKSCIDVIEGNLIKIEAHKIPVGKKYRSNVDRLLK